MNFIANGGYLVRSSRITYWAVTGRMRPVCPLPTVYAKDIIKPDIPRATSAEFLKSRLCVGNLRVISGPFATQIRWKDPVLNRDLEFPDFDYYRKKEFADVTTAMCGDRDDKPGFAYSISLFGLIVTMYGAKSVAIYLVSSMAASAEVLAMANVEVALSEIPEGKTVTVKWRGKPLFIKHRTHAEIDRERKTSVSILRHQQTDEERALNPEWLIVIGICTHLGCVPIPDSGDFPGGFYCPCHGSHYDAAGRARKGPAPLNLEIPPYKFIAEDKVVVG